MLSLHGNDMVETFCAHANQTELLSAAVFQRGSLLKEAIREVVSKKCMICNHDNTLLHSFLVKSSSSFFRIKEPSMCFSVFKCCCCPLVVVLCSYFASFRNCRSRSSRFCSLKISAGSHALRLENLWTTVSTASIFKSWE